MTTSERSSLRVRLSQGMLAKAALPALERLAAWLGACSKRKANESDGAYRHRLVSSISRWEKQYARGATK